MKFFFSKDVLEGLYSTENDPRKKSYNKMFKICHISYCGMIKKESTTYNLMHSYTQQINDLSFNFFFCNCVFHKSHFFLFFLYIKKKGKNFPCSFSLSNILFPSFFLYISFRCNFLLHL